MSEMKPKASKIDQKENPNKEKDIKGQ